MDKVDAILGSEEPIVPSSGFAASVMQRVHEEAAAPPPIPFPWKRAIPGFILALFVLGIATVQFVRAFHTSGLALAFPQIHLGTHLPLDASQAIWLLVAIVLTAASWLLSRRLTSSSGLL